MIDALRVKLNVLLEGMGLKFENVKFTKSWCPFIELQEEFESFNKDTGHYELDKTERAYYDIPEEYYPLFKKLI